MADGRRPMASRYPEALVLDVVYLSLGIGFFLLTALLVKGAERV